MKKITLMLIALSIGKIAFSQSTGVGHSAFSGNYLGWDNSSNQSLQIVHENNWPIEFHTSGGVGSSGIWNNMRMKIFEDIMVAPNNTPNLVGRVGIMEEDDFRWKSNLIPVSLLHLGHGVPRNVGGHRLWMDVGTYTVARNDNMYVGLKHQFGGTEPNAYSDFMDAVISWGDNDRLADGLNDLRFIFAIDQSLTGEAASEEGLEVARFSFNGYCGIGSFRHPTNLRTPTRPARRLEVVDRGDGETSLPQLRLTHEPDNDQFGGVDPRWTDLETTVTGDLFIHPTRRGIDQRVGINVYSPRNTLEINSSALNSLGPGNSGLVLTDLTTASTGTGFNTSGRVLSVDVDGNVILVDDNTTSTGGVAFCPGGSPTNYL